jgi:hypothetical protein
MRARIPSVRILVLAGALLASVSAVGAQALDDRRGEVAPTVAGLEDVNFVSLCRFSHRKPDDPIVFPGQPGMSHDHTFFGSTTTDAYSTAATLRGQRATCSRTADTAAYWAPTLIVDGQRVDALDAAAYYRRTTLARVRPFPARFVMIAGEGSALQPQSTNVVFWSCALDASNPSESVPNCGARSLRLHVVFPECWDGRRFDSSDHKSHVAYASRGVCPSSHSVAVPQLVLIIRYPVNGAGRVELSSYGQFSGHADFVNAWDQGALTELVETCLNALRPCGKAR